MKSPSIPTTYGALVLMLVLSGLDQTILSTALPGIVVALQGRDLAPWVFSAYLLASTAVIPLYGKLADRFGVRPLLLIATALFALGSVACAAATDMPTLVGARALQGLGGGGLLTLTMLAVAALFDPSERPRRMGLLGAAYGISTLVGPLAGGLLLEVAAWPWAFLINVPGAVLALGVLWRAPFAAPSPTRHPLDVAGAVLLAAGLMALLLATRQGGPTGPLTHVAAVTAVVLLAAWWVVERRAEDPVVPLAMFRRPVFAAASVLSVLSGVALFAAVMFVPLYLQQGLGMDAIGSAWHTVPLMAGIAVGGQLAGRALRSGQAPRRVAGLSGLGLTMGYALLAATLHRAHSSDVVLSVALLPVGLSLGLLFPLVTVLAQRSAAARDIGVATATTMMLRALGGALGVAWLDEGLRQHLAHAARAGLHGRADALQALAGGVGDVCAWAAAAGVLVLLVARTLPSTLPTPVLAPVPAQTLNVPAVRSPAA
jgi:EmrB/QacA subfamily drug resistance transporter